jgi:hypothetical protein
MIRKYHFPSGHFSKRKVLGKLLKNKINHKKLRFWKRREDPRVIFGKPFFLQPGRILRRLEIKVLETLFPRGQGKRILNLTRGIRNPLKKRFKQLKVRFWGRPSGTTL